METLKLLIIRSNMPRTIYEPGFKWDHGNIEAIDHLIKYAMDNIWTWAQMGPWKHWSYWSSDQICHGQYMNLGSNGTMETLKLLIIQSNMPRTIYEPGFKWDHGNIESYWSSDQICRGQYMNLGSNGTMETLKAVDHPIKYAADVLLDRWEGDV